MKSSLYACLLALVATSLTAETLTDIQGRSIEVDILNVGKDSVEVRRSDGYKFTIPFTSLDAASRGILEEFSEPEEEEFDINLINETLGLTLWDDSNLWDDPIEKVAQRLGWPQESKTPSQSSYRIYFSENAAQIAGARPHTAVLYGKDGIADYISIMFANKGDSAGSRINKDKKEMLKAINQAIRTDSESIRTKLDTLGESKNETGGITRSMKERAKRWDYGDNSLWLATVEDEYIALRIMRPELAERWGKPEYHSDETVRQAAKANVSENQFGDVMIRNIPMVNQGPKGYCVPATMERYLRYMNIRADMYTLAMAGSTSIGGGTTLQSIIDGTSSYVRRSSRKMETIRQDLEIKDIRKYIDQGQPLMWAMYSTEAYNELADTITLKRTQTKDPKEWKSKLRQLDSDNQGLKGEKSRAHICMIVGYNDETGEIAVSDSWGPTYELRWIPAEQARRVTQGTFYIIDF